MPRKSILGKNSIKVSVDLTKENKKTVTALSQNLSLKFGPTINKIIHLFCRMEAPVKNVIEKACLDEYRRLTVELQNTEDAFHRQSLESERDLFIDFLKMINGGSYHFPKSDDNETMKKIRLEDGYLIIPKNWIVVNPEDATSCRYACVLECRNSVKYGIPHFIYLNNTKYGKHYTVEMEKKFIKACKKVWPKFSKIEELHLKNQPVFDPEDRGTLLNAEAFMNAPTIGFFSITEQGDPIGPSPYGAMLVRETVNEKE